MHRSAIKYMVWSQIDSINRFFNHAKDIDADDKVYILQELMQIENLCFDYLNIHCDLSDKIHNLAIGKLNPDEVTEIRTDIANLKIALDKEM